MSGGRKFSFVFKGLENEQNWEKEVSGGRKFSFEFKGLENEQKD